MNTVIFITMLDTPKIIYYLIGQRYSGKIHSEEDYFLAGKNISFLPLMLTFLATQVGGGVILGSSQEAYRSGWSVFFYPLGGALGLILLGLGVGRKLAQFKVSTIAQILEVTYKSPRLKQFASILSILSLFTTLMAQMIASNSFLASMGLNSIYLYLSFWFIVFLYTSQGGLRAVISTDLVQATFFSSIFLICGLITWFQHPIPLFENMTLSSSNITGWFLMPLLFICIGQDMGQRCFAGDSAKTVSKATIVAGISMMIVCTVPIYFGVLARTLKIEIPSNTNVLMTIIGTLTNPWITSLIACAVIAAVISTVTSLINAISSNLLNDFIKISNLSLIKWFTFFIAFSAVILGLMFENIVTVMIFGYELSVCCLFIPIAFALFKKEGNFLSALLAIICGITSFVLFKFISVPIPKEIAGILCSLFGFGIGALWVFLKSSIKKIPINVITKKRIDES